MRQVKCFLCKEKSDKETMHFEEVGKTKKVRRYFHEECHQEYNRIQELKQKDLQELDVLYQHLLHLHSLELLDGRMMEKIQDLRNGSIKINGQKIKKYKQGISFSLMLDTYKHLNQKIDYILNSMQFQTKWNEFSYIFGMMIKNINAIKQLEKRNEQVNKPKVINQETVNLEVRKHSKKDDLDISDFL